MSDKANSIMEVEEEKLSPMMKHYRSVKAQHMDAIVLYRLGDFYEMFFNDALEASKILDLTLTGRACGNNERAPMCGVPYHAVDTYVNKLVKNGKKVAICEQLNTPSDKDSSQDVLNRDIIRIITPGTITSDEALSNDTNNYLVCLYLYQRKSGSVTWVDVSTGEMKTLEEEKDINKLFDAILIINPSEIISNSDGVTYLKTKEAINTGKLPHPDEFFNYAFDYDDAIKTICDYYKVASPDALGIKDNKLAVSSIGAILQYIQNTQKRVLENINIPKIIIPDDVMFLDYNTKRNLELTETITDRSSVGTLYWVLNKTKTNMGARMLKRWIQEPLRRSEDIAKRLDAVDELYKNSEVRTTLMLALNEIRDIERLCNKLAYNTAVPKDCLAFLTSLEQVPTIKKLLSKQKSAYLNEIYQNLDCMEDIKNILSTSIFDKDAPIDNNEKPNKDYLIKPGYSVELDNLRNIKNTATKWLIDYEIKQREETGIKTLRTGYNKIFGYYIEISKSFVQMAPYNYIRKQTLTTGERYITEELKGIEEKVLTADSDAETLENQLYGDIKQKLLENIKKFQQNADNIAILDVLCSFAQVASKNDYVRPVINKKFSKIDIKNGRHPVVEALKNTNSFVPNDTIIDENSSTLIVTGPNMAGKSTYMRQVAVIVLMAHIGCFVPAEKAEICLVDRIFTRVGASDNLALGQSTFMVEMIEVANILNNATKNSLLILDEIGRGTSTLDGMSIAWAVVEYVSLTLKVKTLFATHYHELSELENIIPNLKNYHVLIKESQSGITFLYKIARGGANKSFGIEVASLAGVNKKVIDRAKRILETLEETHALSNDVDKKLSENVTENAVPTSQITFFNTTANNKDAEITKIIEDIDIDSITPIQALTILSDIKKKVESNNNKRGRKK